MQVTLTFGASLFLLRIASPFGEKRTQKRYCYYIT